MTTNEIGLNFTDAHSGDRIYVGIRRFGEQVALVLSAEKSGDVEVVLETAAAQIAGALIRIGKQCPLGYSIATPRSVKA
jgi:hypothetical protein